MEFWLQTELYKLTLYPICISYKLKTVIAWIISKCCLAFLFKYESFYLTKTAIIGYNFSTLFDTEWYLEELSIKILNNLVRSFLCLWVVSVEGYILPASGDFVCTFWLCAENSVKYYSAVSKKKKKEKVNLPEWLPVKEQTRFLGLRRCCYHWIWNCKLHLVALLLIFIPCWLACCTPDSRAGGWNIILRNIIKQN